MASTYEYYMWQDFNNKDSNDIDVDCDIFDIQIHFHHVLEIHYPESNQIPVTTTHRSFPIPRNLIFSSDDQSRSSIMDAILSTTAASRDFIDLILPEVSSFALEMATHPSNKNVKVLTMGLLICVVTPYDEREEIDRALGETIQEKARFKPASKSCIEGLKRVRIDKDDDKISGETCMVCLEKESVGEVVIRLACGHVFHEDCIVKWLHTNHLCPLCRFSIS
ncbi:E3 ubiquitin-protein ligase ATL4-like [Ricinus communis]|uniref:RING-type E3 ubiquitin transferase n=1 Tax=Ricinus communis TaxID=3988 RepID=B9RJ35_RICCO|nr:E3 ubiquitin-protein ligase ATL4-like [Ricinus communis]EEF48337.1 zinc finger protein, putative [Ricinus communis]